MEYRLGEVLGVFDRARRIGRLSNGDYIIAKRRFLSETKRLIKLGVMIIVPLKTGIIKETWNLIEKHHIYEADALQLASARYVKAQTFMTGDRQTHEAALKEGLKSIYLA